MKPMTTATFWLKDKTPDELDEEIRKIGRKLFSTPEGAVWLTAVLDDLRYGTHAITERDVALKNYATTILRDRIGLTKDSLAVTTALLNIGTEAHADDHE